MTGQSDTTAKGQARSILSNMVELEYLELLKLSTAKDGGGLDATADELILVAGDGQMRIVDLKSGRVNKSQIEVPPNNEAAALIAAQKVEPTPWAERAERQVKGHLRYDDILVFSDEQHLHLVLSFAHFNAEQSCFNHRVAKLSIPGPIRLQDIAAAPSDWEVIFSSEPCFSFRKARQPYRGEQSGGRMDLLDSEQGTIVLALGDYAFDGRKVPSYPQNMDADYGKIWKLNIHTRQREIISIGHRNTQGIRHDSTGRLWTTEHGPQGGDELNLVTQGENYGWPKVTLGIDYAYQPWPFNPNQGRHDGFRAPVFSWAPSIGLSNIDQSINFHPFWEGDLLAFSLKSQSIFRLRLQDDRVIMVEPIPFLQERIRYGFNHDDSGVLFLWTDSGTLYQLTPTASAMELVETSRNRYEAFRQGLSVDDTLAPNVLDDCLKCHSGGLTSAPDLAGVFGRKIGESSYANYSPALARIDQTWNQANLKVFLKNPQAFAPGTAMPDPMISDEKMLNDIVNALQELE
jgi:cytochrome c2